MIELPAERMAAVMGAKLVGRGPGDFPERAVIDSRQAAGGELFFGLTGLNDDGGRFAGTVLENGAWGAVLTPEWAAKVADSGHFVFATEDPLLALQTLARAWRRELEATVIGVTGSVGKTSVKDITRAILPGPVHASSENFNTEIGLPLTILEAPAGTGTLVLEMAMRGAGQIAELAGIAEPDIGVITNVGPVHVELLGSIAAVAAAKAELIAGLRSGGTMVVPVEAGELEPHLAGVSGLVRFGPGGDVAFDGEAGVDPESGGTGTVVRITTRQGDQKFHFPFTEAHNLSNALAAVAAGIAAGATPDELASRTGRIAFSRLRGEHIPLGPEGERGLVINDCYNANPVSMRSALEYLAGLQQSRKVAVLGLMGELGPDQDRFHAEIGDLARELGIDVLIGVGEVARGYRPDRDVTDPAAAAAAVRELIGPETAVLIKGSRAAGLEAVTELLVESEGSAV